MQHLDKNDQKLLSLIQHEFPVCSQPFAALGERLQQRPADVLDRIRCLFATGLIKRVGAIFDSRRLGFQTTLVAARVPETRISDIAGTINRFEGVSHNYRRNHDYNLWFTLQTPSQAKLERTIDRLKESTGIGDMHTLPAVSIYNRRVTFDLNGQPKRPAEGAQVDPEPVSLNDEQKKLVRVIQGNIPLAEASYSQIAHQIDWSETQVMDQIREWLSGNVIRRMGAIVQHRRVGFHANGMAVFATNGESVEEIGHKIARYSKVTHCCHRQTFPGWPYNLFAMVHDDTESKVRAHVETLAQRFGIKDYEILFSTQEYKKVSPRYF